MRKLSLMIVCLFVLSLSLLPFANVKANAGFYANLTSPATQDINQLYLYGEKSSGNYTHMGVDFLCPEGSPVKAAASGTVYISRDLTTSYGKYIVLKHYDSIRGTYYTIYAHLSQRLVEVGDTVTYGQTIGYSGNTGNSEGAHLHFEIRHSSDYNNYYGGGRNPECWLQRSNYNGYGSVYAMCKESDGTRITQMRIPGATKPESNYGASYTYALTDKQTELGDIAAYGINYHIARAYPGSVTLEYQKSGYTTKTQNVTIESNISKRINDMIW